MSPQNIETMLPDGFTLAPRPTCFHVDERPTLRDEHGRVRAVVERVELWVVG